MDASGDSTASTGRRNWLIVLAGAWALLGIWSITDEDVVLGVGQVVLGALGLAAALSPRIAAIVDAPLFRRKRTPDAG